VPQHPQWKEQDLLEVSMVRRWIGLVLGMCFVVGCGEPTQTAKKSENRQSRGVYSSDERLLIKFVSAERLSPTEASVSVKITNSEQQVAGTAVVDPANFYIGPEGTNAEPVSTYEPAKTTFKKTTLQNHESVEGKVFFTLPSPAAMNIVYGDSPALSVRVGTIPAAQ
jgi:hypothetical protein